MDNPAPTALAELLDGERRQLLGTRLELGQELFDVAGSRVEELALDDLAGCAAARVTKGAL